MKCLRMVILLLSASFVALSGQTLSCHAQTKLPALFSDHMVLQQRAKNRLWGWDEPGTAVTVSVQGESVQTTTDADGNWMVVLPDLAAPGPYEITVAGTQTIQLADVLVGEVWICSGQSNMEWTVQQSQDAAQEIAAGNHPQIRHIKIQHVPAAEPQDDVQSGGWQVATPETVAQFTAVGYFFARELQQELDVPIGLIGSNWGGTRIEPWTPPKGFQQVASLSEIADNLSRFPEKNDKGDVIHQSPLALYNGMIHPLLKYKVRGALWYQGESNVGEGLAYRDKMQALIGGWRAVFNRPDLPFYFVQLAPFRYGDPTALPEIWDAQRRALEIENTGMAVTTDIGNVGDIHPANKQEVGRRLALWALAKTYARADIVCSGPLLRNVMIEGNKLRVEFDYADDGLATRDGKSPSDFSVAGTAGEFVPAEAKIDGNTVVVWSATVDQPARLRFGWNQEANPNLTNKNGLPASPFQWSE